MSDIKILVGIYCRMVYLWDWIIAVT